MKNKLGIFQKKLLIIFLGGTSMAFAYSPLKQYEILREMREEWKKVKNQQFERSIGSLYKIKLLSKKEKEDGTVEFTLTKKGKEIAFECVLNNLVIKKPKKWDGKWRIVMFDVPEPLRRVRNSIRHYLNKLEFFELQKSVFIHPFECGNEVAQIVEFYEMKKFVRFAVVDFIDNEKYLKKHFNLK